MKDSFGPLKKSIWRARAPNPQSAQLRPQARRAQSPQSGKCEVLERLILAEPRDHRASARFWSV